MKTKAKKPPDWIEEAKIEGKSTKFSLWKSLNRYRFWQKVPRLSILSRSHWWITNNSCLGLVWRIWVFFWWSKSYTALSWFFSDGIFRVNSSGSDHIHTLRFRCKSWSHFIFEPDFGVSLVLSHNRFVVLVSYNNLVLGKVSHSWLKARKPFIWNREQNIITENTFPNLVYVCFFESWISVSLNWLLNSFSCTKKIIVFFCVQSHR